MTVKSFAERLQELMEMKHLNNAEFARAVGLSKSSISRYLSGQFQAKQDTIFMIARNMNVDPAWMLGYDVPIAPESFRDQIDLDMITADEIAVIKEYRKLSPDDQAFIIATIKRLQK